MLGTRGDGGGYSEERHIVYSVMGRWRGSLNVKIKGCGGWEDRLEARLLGGTTNTNGLLRSHMGKYYYKSFLKYIHI